MPKSKLTLLLVIGLLVSSTLAWASSPQDYMISYTYKNPDGTIFRITKYYLLNGNKFRIEYRTPVQYDINNTEMQKEQLPSDIEPHTIEILRKDKGLVWSLDPSYKNYIEVPLRADSWEHATTSIFVIDFLDYKKTGEVKLLDYNCDIYESVQKEEKDSWTSILYVAQDLKVILKTKILQNGKLVQTMEATEFSTDKPDKSLFEIPDGYQKNDNSQ